jgi:hypothetical protein
MRSKVAEIGTWKRPRNPLYDPLRRFSSGVEQPIRNKIDPVYFGGFSLINQCFMRLFVA